MYKFTIFNNLESILLPTKTSICGSLLTEILNNYDNILDKFNNSIQNINSRKKYNLDIFSTDDFNYSDSLSDNMNFFYGIISSEFYRLSQSNLDLYNDMIQKIEQKKLLLKNTKNENTKKSIMEDLNSYETIKNAYTIEKRLQYLIKYLEKIKQDLSFTYNGINNYIQNNITTELTKNKYFFEIPRYKIYSAIIKNNSITILKPQEKYKNHNADYLYEYTIEKVDDLLDIYINLIIEKKIFLKQCKNCGKYFIPHNKQVYCDNPSPQNKKYTCRLLPDDMRNNKNPIYETYRNNYKTQSNKKRRNNHIPDIENRFSKWNEEAKNKMKECQMGNITLDEYKLWLKHSQNWINNNNVP